jgi:hypothetical protein
VRPLSAPERAYLDRLMSADFAGRREIMLQIASALARTIDSEGSIELQPQVTVAAPVQKRVPVEAEGLDVDGVPIYFLLHVVDSRVHELEIYKADGSTIRRLPDPQELTVTVLPGL